MDYDAEYDQIPDLADTLEFVDNPDQRTPCGLLLDTSWSMVGRPIDELNAGLEELKSELMSDPLARRRVEISVITFGGSVEVVQDFVTVEQFVPPRLRAAGGTPMGEGIDRALDRVGLRKSVYRQARVPHTRPWVFMITDGAPTDDWQQAAARVHRASAARQVAFFAVGVAGADMATLAEIADPARPPLRLAGLKFRELFQWLSNSLGQVSCSAPGDSGHSASAGWVATSMKAVSRLSTRRRPFVPSFALASTTRSA